MAPLNIAAIAAEQQKNMSNISPEDAEDHAKGMLIVDTLSLPLYVFGNGSVRVDTSHGTKTPAGLYRMLNHMLNKGWPVSSQGTNFSD